MKIELHFTFGVYDNKYHAGRVNENRYLNNLLCTEFIEIFIESNMPLKGDKSPSDVKGRNIFTINAIYLIYKFQFLSINFVCTNI